MRRTTRTIKKLLVALIVCAILAALAPPLPVAVANDLGAGRLNPTMRRQLLQQKKARDAEATEANEKAQRRWLGKIEREADPLLEEDPVDGPDDESDDFYNRLLEYD